MEVKLVWQTPDGENRIGHMARVSNYNANPDDSPVKLIRYMIKHKHWSPFEMVNMCVEINTTRDISRQILRHRSFHFQEFSQRYSVVNETPEYSEARTQDNSNRQNSIVTNDITFNTKWLRAQRVVWEFCYFWYELCLASGVAKELARKLLPEGLTKTRMYMNGTVRDWIHYIQIRTGQETQKEHRQVAMGIRDVFRQSFPQILEAIESGESK